MTIVSAHSSTRQSHVTHRNSLALKLAFRSLRGGIKGFYIFLICIALGAGAIGGINNLSEALSDAIRRDGKVLLGGDAEATLIHRQASEQELNHLSSQGQLSKIAALRAMARLPNGSRQQLIDLKSVDEAYPLYGQIKLERDADFANVMKSKEIAVDRSLLDQLQMQEGDMVTIGRGSFKIGAVIEQEPDKLAAGPSFGARVLMPLSMIDATGLIEPGSLVRWSYRIRLNESDEAKSFKDELTTRFPEAGFQVRDSRDPTPGITNTIKRLTAFLTLVALTAMITGGLGVANAVSAIIEQRRKTIAIFKALGAAETTIFKVFFFEISIVTAIGIAIGLLLAMVLPAVMVGFLSKLVPIPIDIGFHWRSLILAISFSVLTALPFVLWPLGKAQQIKAAELLRNEPAVLLILPPLQYRLAAIAAIVILVVAAIVFSNEQTITAWTCVGLMVAFALFYGVGMAIKSIAQNITRPKKRASLTLALVNLGSGTTSRTIALSLGTGLTLLTAVALVKASLSQELLTHIPDAAPSHFFIDIGKQDLDPFLALVRKDATQAKVNVAPMLRGRIVSLNDVPADRIKPPANIEWVLSGDRGLTYSETLPVNSYITNGAWWPVDYEGEALVSFETDIGKGLGLKIGDHVTVNVLGRNISAKVANFRTVKWNTADINFVMVFSPNALKQAPFKYIATLSWPKDVPQNTEEEETIVRSISTQLPAISAIRVRDILNDLSSVFEKVMAAVQIAGSVTLIMGACVVAGALIATQRKRIHEAVILRSLGASKTRILIAHSLEYFIIAAAISLIAAGFGLLAAYMILTFVMDLHFNLSLKALLQPPLIETLFVLIMGTIGTLRILSAKPVVYLRSQ